MPRWGHCRWKQKRGKTPGTPGALRSRAPRALRAPLALPGSRMKPSANTVTRTISPEFFRGLRTVSSCERAGGREAARRGVGAATLLGTAPAQVSPPVLRWQPFLAPPLAPRLRPAPARRPAPRPPGPRPRVPTLPHHSSPSLALAGRLAALALLFLALFSHLFRASARESRAQCCVRGSFCQIGFRTRPCDLWRSGALGALGVQLRRSWRPDIA